MTENKDLKRQVRARMKETGAPYTAVLAELHEGIGHQPLPGPPMPIANVSQEKSTMKYSIHLRSQDEPMVVEADEYDEPSPISGLITFYRQVGDRKVPVASVKIQDLMSIGEMPE